MPSKVESMMFEQDKQQGAVPLVLLTAGVHRAAILLTMLLIALTLAEKQPSSVFEQSAAGCINPLGFLAETRFYRRTPLYADTTLLFKTAKVEAGCFNEWSPGDECLGVQVAVEPIAFFTLSAKAGLYGVYKQFGFGYRRLKGPDGPYGNAFLATLPQESRAGSRIALVPTLQAKIASFIVVNSLAISRVDMFGSDEFFYEIRSALPHATHDYDFSNDAFLLLECTTKLTAGIQHNLVYVASSGERQQKVCGVVLYSRATKKYTRVFCALLAGGYTESKLRRGSFYAGVMGGFELPVGRGGRRRAEVREPDIANSSAGVGK